MGFYTVEIKNMETNTVQSKADLLIMENLFFEQNISQTFDLKGIQGRKVKSNTSGSTKRTLFDGEWIEGERLRKRKPHWLIPTPRPRTKEVSDTSSPTLKARP